MKVTRRFPRYFVRCITLQKCSKAARKTKNQAKKTGTD